MYHLQEDWIKFDFVRVEHIRTVLILKLIAPTKTVMLVKIKRRYKNEFIYCWYYYILFHTSWYLLCILFQAPLLYFCYSLHLNHLALRQLWILPEGYCTDYVVHNIYTSANITNVFLQWNMRITYIPEWLVCTKSWY